MAQIIVKESIQKARPFLKWVGGKARLIDQFSILIPKEYNAYFEPFLGGGAVFFNLNPEIAHINDVNKKLMATYKVIKTMPKKLIKSLAVIEADYLKLDEEGRKLFYYNQREQFNTTDKSSFEYAELMIFLNKTCYNGMYRENAAGGFNVPFGRYVTPKICDSLNIQASSIALKNTTITSLDYTKAVKSAKKGDFIYLDPPYDPLTKTSSFTSYSSDSFSKFDQVNLRDLFVELDSRGCKVMLSNSYTDYIKDLYKGYYSKVVKAKRSINSKPDARGLINEIVITNYQEN